MNTLSVSHLTSPRMTLSITNHLDRAFLWKIVKQGLAITCYFGGQWVLCALDWSAFLPSAQLAHNCSHPPLTHIIKTIPNLLWKNYELVYNLFLNKEKAWWLERKHLNSSAIVININLKCVLTFWCVFVLTLFIPVGLFFFFLLFVISSWLQCKHV